jgi:hypothetical protein
MAVRVLLEDIEKASWRQEARMFEAWNDRKPSVNVIRFQGTP